MVPKEYSHILIQNNLEKSDEAISAAIVLLSNKLSSSALNRIYYAIFYTVSALAEKHDFCTSKHITLMKWFNKKFVYEMKTIDEDMFIIYKKAFKFRQKNDYDTLYKPTVEDAESLLNDATLLINSLREIILGDVK